MFINYVILLAYIDKLPLLVLASENCDKGSSFLFIGKCDGG